MDRFVRRVKSPNLVLALVTAAVFTDMLLYDLVVPFLPAHLRDGAVSETGIGLLFGCYSLALLLATPVAGALTDRVGRRPVVLAGLAGLGASAALYCSSDRFAVVVAARCLQGAAGAALWTGGLALLADAFPPAARGKALGTAMAGVSLGALLGPPLGGWLFESGGYRLPFLLAGGLIGGVGLAVFLGLREVERMPRPAARRAAFRDRQLVVTAGAVVVGATVLSLLEPTLPLHLSGRLRAGPTTIGLLFLAATAAYGLCCPLAGAFSDRWGRKGAIAFGLVATLVSLPLVALPGTWLGEACALVPLGVACAFLLSPVLPELAELADRRDGGGYGRAYAVFNTAYAVGMLAGPVAGGWLTAKVGLFRALSLVSLGALFYLPVFLRVRRPLEVFPAEP